MCITDLTFFSLGVGDLEVAVSGFQLLSPHDLALQLAHGDVQPVESHRVVVKFRGKLIMNTRHFYTHAFLSDQIRLFTINTMS